MAESLVSQAFARWRPAFMRRAAAPAADGPVASAIQQGPAPTGPPKGSLVAVSLYLPFGVDVTPYVAALVRLGYSNLEIRDAGHDATKTRVSAQARVPVVDVLESEVLDTLTREFTEHALAPYLRADVQTWPTY
ncbi:MAG: hypothetical protein IT181_13065 [Acidobacteria bacterium]|nr:hypothetical protein [Acidobacteriota bacterium]